jgi:hypothetical protein
VDEPSLPPVEEKEDEKTRQRLHSENAYILFPGIRESTEVRNTGARTVADCGLQMMNKRLKQALGHQQRLKEEEKRSSFEP